MRASSSSTSRRGALEARKAVRGASTLTRVRSLRVAGLSLPDVGFFVICVLAVIGLAYEAFTGPTAFVQISIFGLADGAMFALVALGYTMVYGIIELINFAHGDVFTLGAYIGTAILGFFAVNENSFTTINFVALLLVFPVVMLIMGAINIGIERIAYRPLRNAPRLAPLITAIGMSFILAGLMFLGKGPFHVIFPDPLPNTQLAFGNFTVGVKDIFVVVSALVLVMILSLFI